MDLQRSVKYALDRVVACLLIGFFSPVLMGVAVAIRRRAPGSAFDLQERVGAAGRPFTVFRFRTEPVASGEVESGSPPATRPRPAARVERWLQDPLLVALPQLFNIALGEMSFVGPRAATRKEHERYTPRQRRRLLFRPGITGWAQVNQAGAAAVEAEVECDLYYVDHFSLGLDLAILRRSLGGSGQAASRAPARQAAAEAAPAPPSAGPMRPLERERLAPLPLLVIGAGGHARVVVDVAEKQGRYGVVGLLDDRPGLAGTRFMGYPVLGGRDVLQRDDLPSHAFVAIGAPRAREAWQQHLEDRGFQIATLVHPSAQIGREVVLAPGTVVMAGGIINSGSRIGRGVIVNTAASIDHDCEVGDFAHVAPGARLAGGVRVGARAHVGIGSCVLQNLGIDDDAVVGGGAAVVRPVPPGVTVVGVPARPLPARRAEAGRPPLSATRRPA